MILLAIIALIVIPPEKLPDAARQLARFLNDLKRNTSGIWDDIKKDALQKPEDINRHKPTVPVEPVGDTGHDAGSITQAESDKKNHE